MAEEGRSRLGRGLAALIGDVGEETKAVERARSQRRVPIEHLKPNPRNPRRHFSDPEIDELAASIKERGIIQPIVVRPAPGTPDAFEIIAGERRWRAAQRAEQHEVPIVVVEVSDGEALELAIIENVQRADLNPLEEAAGYQTLVDQYGHSHDEIAKIVGKSRSYVANAVRLLKLSDTVKAYIHAGKLTAGHARMLVGQPDAEAIAEEIVARGLNVRQVEAWARRSGKEQAREFKAKQPAVKDADMTALEKRVSDALGLQVSVDHRGEGGTLHIHYRDLDQLDEVLRRLEDAR
jgi:ParB family transcriptional regulator, chromosome partitioning protein